MTCALAGRDGGVRGKDAGRVRIRRIRAQLRTQNRALQRGQTARAHFVGASKAGQQVDLWTAVAPTTAKAQRGDDLALTASLISLVSP